MRSQKVVFAGLSLLVLGAIVTAGNLTPPAGPVAPTMKTLSEVEPRIPLSQSTAPGDATNQYRISQPGSYYLTGNITGVSGKTCIYVASSRVTLDLNGFTLEGVAGSLIGIRVNSEYGVSVRNGNVYDFSVGVDAYETYGCRLENLTSARHNSDGFRVGRGSMVERCVAFDCSPGFDIFEAATLTACEARQGGTLGFDVGNGCTLRDCVAIQMPTGFSVTGMSVLENCIARENQSRGFFVEESSVLTGCISQDAANIGFVVVARSRLTRCTARDSIYGFTLIEGNTLVECTSSANSSHGVYISGNSNTVERSTFHENAAAGIYVFDGAGNNIDGNLLSYNGTYGMHINSSDNFAVRNRARGNGTLNYVFVSGVDYGVILTNPGAGFTSSAAWANFAY